MGTMGLMNVPDEPPPLSTAECVATCHKIRDMIDGWFANITMPDESSDPQNPIQEGINDLPVTSWRHA
jgi:hypothetical protein